MPAILIIDDDDAVRLLLEDALTENGFDVVSAPSGVEGVEIAQTEHVDVVITDILMPDKDGLETLMELKKSCPHIKVLVISGSGEFLENSFLEMANKLGADASLAKPLDIKQLISTVSDLVR